MRAYPKEVYGWYESASLHTGKVRIPKQVWMVAACALLVPTLGYFAFTKVYANVTKQAAPAQAQQGQQQQPPQGMEKGGAVRKLTAAEYAEERTPRFAGFAHTAPAYDEVTKPVEAPYPAACVQMKGECRCYTQQATRLQVPLDTCLQIVKHGFFVDWQQKPHKDGYMSADIRNKQGQSSQERGQQSYPIQSGQIAASQVSQLAGQQEAQEPLNQWSQGLQARNAQVRSSFQR